MFRSSKLPSWFYRLVLIFGVTMLVVAGFTRCGQKETATSSSKRHLSTVSVVLSDDTPSYGVVQPYFSRSVEADYEQDCGRRAPVSLTLRFYKSGEYLVSFHRTPGEDVVRGKGGLLHTSIAVNRSSPQSTIVRFAKSGWRPNVFHEYDNGETIYVSQEIPDNLRVTITRKRDGKTESHDF